MKSAHEEEEFEDQEKEIEGGDNPLASEQQITNVRITPSGNGASRLICESREEGQGYGQ